MRDPRAEHALSRADGLAVFCGGLADNGCIVEMRIHSQVFGTGPRVREPGGRRHSRRQDPGGRRRLRGGPGMQETLHPASYLKSKGLWKACALITDGRFSGGTSDLSIGHISPEGAEGRMIALVRNGDRISIDILSRNIRLELGEEELTRRRAAERARGDAVTRSATGNRGLPQRSPHSASRGRSVRFRGSARQRLECHA